MFLSEDLIMSPLSLEVMRNQATINIGTIGHVAHGKSTVVHAISNIKTMRFKKELEQNKTIRLGYANTKIFQCSHCPRPESFQASDSSKPTELVCENCNKTMNLIRHISFVDCPGHEELMAQMLTGAAVMDGALLLIAGNETCPQPQTSEHLRAIEIIDLKNIIILQNKIDLVKEPAVKQQYEDIRNFTRGTIADGAQVIPISAQLRYNVDVICEYLVKKIPVPERNFTLPPQMLIIRSFDNNLPGTKIDNIIGGIAGGTILQGMLKKDQEIEVRPGRIFASPKGEITCEPYNTKIKSLYSEKNQLNFAVAGGLIGVGMMIDPFLTKGNKLVGQILGHKGNLPNIFTMLEIKYSLLPRLLGLKMEKGVGLKKIGKLTLGETLKAYVGSMEIRARVLAVSAAHANLDLEKPRAICADVGAKIALSRKIGGQNRLIGYGTIKAGKILFV